MLHENITLYFLLAIYILIPIPALIISKQKQTKDMLNPKKAQTVRILSFLAAITACLGIVLTLLSLFTQSYILVCYLPLIVSLLLMCVAGIMDYSTDKGSQWQLTTESQHKRWSEKERNELEAQRRIENQDY